MNIALFGRSLTGKSTLAALLARELGLPLRSCGDVVRAAAREARETLESASDDLHRRVDEDTRAWLVNTGGIVEGRFLDAVLDAGVALMIELRADAGVRLERLGQRRGGPVDTKAISEIDRADDLFRANLYSTGSIREADIIYDTSSQTPDDTLATVLRSVGR